MSAGHLAGLRRRPAPEREITLGPGCRLWIRKLSGAVRVALERERDPEVRLGKLGQAAIVRWEGVRLSGDLARWHPAMRQNGLLPYSPQNAGLLYLRAEVVRDAVDAALADWNV